MTRALIKSVAVCVLLVISASAEVPPLEVLLPIPDPAPESNEAPDPEPKQDADASESDPGLAEPSPSGVTESSGSDTDADDPASVPAGKPDDGNPDAGNGDSVETAVESTGDGQQPEPLVDVDLIDAEGLDIEDASGELPDEAVHEGIERNSDEPLELLRITNPDILALWRDELPQFDDKPENQKAAGAILRTDFEVTADGESGSGVISADLIQTPDETDDNIRLTKQDVRALETQNPQLQAGAALSLSSRKASVRVFGSASTKTTAALLSQARRKKAARTSAAIVLGIESRSRATTDAGDLLTKSAAGIGVARQKRTPVITDTRVRGTGAGKQVANGSYWVPARLDLDTLMSKLDSRLVDNMIVIKGPYSALYGPGYNFTDIDLLKAPRYADGFEAHGSSSLEYKTNGEQWYGRQSLWGGGEDWGYRVGYGHRTGSDYDTGDDRFSLPTSYNSRFVDITLGYDFSQDEHLEFHYLRLDQSDVEFPGMAFDMNYLVTNSWEFEYILEDQASFDELSFEAWYNLTRFQGDTFAAGKRRQIPTLRLNLFPFDGSGDVSMVAPNLGMPQLGMGAAITDVWTLSTGYSSVVTWGENGDPQLQLGADLRYIARELNDVEIFRPTASNNFPIPPSYSANPGLLAEYELPVDEDWTIRTGGRLDFVMTKAQNEVPGVGTTTGDPMMGFTGTPQLITDRLMTSRLDRNFTLWSWFLTLEHEVDENITASFGAGFSQRAPNLTELYAAGPFVNLLQSGLTTLTGDPQLDKERLRQIDASIDLDYDEFRAHLGGFHAWVEDYITFDGGLLTEAQIGQLNNRILFTNTDRATLAGFEASAELDVHEQVTLFTSMNYTEGRDHTRRAPSRIRGTGNRSDSATTKEPLPNIPPFEARFGTRIHSLEGEAPWAIELSARMVDNQDRFASSLFERGTPGFTVWDVRGYWQVQDNFSLTAGVENFTDKFYREHLDYRAGLGVFQPGINFYFGAETTY